MDDMGTFWQSAVRLSLQVGGVLLALTFLAGLSTLLLRSRATRLFLAVSLACLALAGALLVFSLAMGGTGWP